MKSIEISNKTHLIRHWFKWYRVQRGGTDWQPLVVQKRPQPFSIAKTAEALAARSGSKPRLPEILDEKAADAQAALNTPKKPAQRKKGA